MIINEDSITVHSKNRSYLIYAKSLAVLYFRLPYVGDLIDSSLKLDDKDIKEIAIYNFVRNFKYIIPTKKRNTECAHNNNNPLKIDLITKDEEEFNRKKLSLSPNKVNKFNEILQNELNSKRSMTMNGWNKNTVPILLWRRIYTSISNRNYSINVKKLSWLTYFQDGGSFLYILFLHEWITYILNSLSHIEDQNVFDIKSMQNYKDMELTFLYILRKTNPIKMTTEMLTCSCLLLRCNIELIDFYMKYALRNTKTFDIFSIYGMNELN